MQCVTDNQFMSPVNLSLQTMENSITRDYVTEKVYDGLMAGCVPIYLGAPNIDDYIPDSNAIVNYAILGSPEALKAELERLAADQELYEQKLLWKTAGQHEWTAGECTSRSKAACRFSTCGTFHTTYSWGP
jgi:hypothetical protein